MANVITSGKGFISALKGQTRNPFPKLLKVFKHGSLRAIVIQGLGNMQGFYKYHAPGPISDEMCTVKFTVLDQCEDDTVVINTLFHVPDKLMPIHNDMFTTSVYDYNIKQYITLDAKPYKYVEMPVPRILKYVDKFVPRYNTFTESSIPRDMTQMEADYIRLENFAVKLKSIPARGMFNHMLSGLNDTILTGSKQ